jgi:hypothetical protein
LANGAGGVTGRGEVEAAAVTAANEGVRANSEGSESDEVLHLVCCSANVEGVVSLQMNTVPFLKEDRFQFDKLQT